MFSFTSTLAHDFTNTHTKRAYRIKTLQSKLRERKQRSIQGVFRACAHARARAQNIGHAHAHGHGHGHGISKYVSELMKWCT